MAAIALMDMLRRNPNFGGQGFSSRGLFSAKFVGTSATFAAAAPFAFGSLFRNGVMQVAYCDVGVPAAEEALGEDYFSRIHSASTNIFQNDALKYSTKQYDVTLKPLFSAFHWKTFAMTSIRSFLIFYMPLLEPRPPKEDEDDDFLEEQLVGKPVDLVAPFHRSVKQIVRETSVVTTRRVLERFAVHYVSQRMAWKLLKDVPKSAVRKAGRRLPTSTYIFCVTRSTFRGHFLGVLASWNVQVGVDIYQFFKSLWNPDVEEEDDADTSSKVILLGKRVSATTLKCCSSLVFASIGAGVGAALFRPSAGQWIGCTIGDLAGPVAVTFFFKEAFHLSI